MNKYNRDARCNPAGSDEGNPEWLSQELYEKKDAL
jgi:hypothetical protein